MARTISHLPQAIGSGSYTCAIRHSLLAPVLWPVVGRGSHVSEKDIPSSHHANESLALQDRHSEQVPLLKQMDHILDRHLFGDGDDVARHDVRRCQLTEVFAIIHHPQQVKFTH